MKRFKCNSTPKSDLRNGVINKKIITEVKVSVNVKFFNFEELSLSQELQMLKMLKQIMAHFGINVDDDQNTSKGPLDF